MIKLKDLLLENLLHIKQYAHNKGYNYETYRGDVDADNIFKYTKKERREVGIFTTPVKEVAKIYSRNNEPRKFYIKSEKTLDLTKDTPSNIEWVERWGESFDVWIDRSTGENVSAWDVLSSGQLFDYEGTWSAKRWMDIQSTAKAEGYNMVILPDYDSKYGIFPSYVVFDEKNLKLADDIAYYNNSEIPIEQRFNSSIDDIRY